MNIGWKYLDTRDATVAALLDYGSMQYIVEHTDENIRRMYADLTDPGSPNMERVMGSTDPHAGESKIVGTLDKMDVYYHRYEEAKEYLAWFEPAWKAITEDERYILSKFYDGSREYGDAVAEELAEVYHIDRSSVYRKKNRAVVKLATLLYGK